MTPPRWFLLVYAASGAAALIYEVAWTRLLTLYLGHGVAAASTVELRVDGDGVGSPLGRTNGLCTGSGVDGDHGVVERFAT